MKKTKRNFTIIESTYSCRLFSILYGRVFAALLVVSLVYSSQSLADDTQYWSSIQLTSKVDDRYSTYGEITHRYSNEAEDFTVRSLRFGGMRKFAETWSYALILENRKTDRAQNDEIRLINQISNRVKLENLDLSFRGRLEFREFENSKVIQNRFRFQARLDGVGYEFWGLVPILSYEYAYIFNTVETRPAESTEMRAQIGIGFDAFGGGIELFYLDRTQASPALEGAMAKSSRFHISNSVFKWSF
jgi:hypothetical protein